MAIPKTARKDKLILVSLALAMALVALLNFLHYSQQHQNQPDSNRMEMLLSDNRRLRNELRRLQQQRPNDSMSATKETSSLQDTPPYQQKARSIRRFYWPDASNSPLVAKLYQLMHPADCDSPNTKYMIWRSLRKNEEDTRGLSAWGHTGTWMLLHGELIILVRCKYMFLTLQVLLTAHFSVCIAILCGIVLLSFSLFKL